MALNCSSLIRDWLQERTVKDPSFEKDLRMYVKLFAEDDRRNGWLSMASCDYCNHFPSGMKITRAILDLRDMIKKNVRSIKPTLCVVGYVSKLPGQSSS